MPALICAWEQYPSRGIIRRFKKKPHSYQQKGLYRFPGKNQFEDIYPPRVTHGVA